MQQIAVLDYSVGRVDIYTLDFSEDPEEFIVNTLGLNLDEVSWMSKDDVIPVEIHCD